MFKFIADYYVQWGMARGGGWHPTLTLDRHSLLLFIYVFTRYKIPWACLNQQSAHSSSRTHNKNVINSSSLPTANTLYKL